MNGAEEADGLAAIAPALHLFGRLLVREIDDSLLDVLRRPDIRDAFEAADPECARLFDGRKRAADLEALAEEYARLFLLPGGASPRAGAWLAGEEARATVAVRARAYEEALGLDPDPEIRNLPQDHAARLLLLAAAALSSRDPRARTAGGQAIRELLAPWLPAFGAALRERATTPVYRALGALLSVRIP